MMETLRADCEQSEQTIALRLMIEEVRLWLEWGTRRQSLQQLPEAPQTAALDELSERLRLASETSNSELLQLRNRQINEELGRFMATAAQQMAEMEAALERRKAELEESMRQAETDALTGLFNRGAYDTRLREAWLRCERQHEPMSLLLLDLDHFKQVNDTYGHQVGDEYLQRMAVAMRGAVREHVDLPCRMGGDEFAIIAFAALDAAAEVAARVLESMEGRVSIGVAQLRPEDTVQTLVARADAALYEAKRRGRGRFALEGEVAPAALPAEARA
jgi:diguanylate cyclase (GGDEF)-like protein